MSLDYVIEYRSSPLSLSHFTQVERDELFPIIEDIKSIADTQEELDWSASRFSVVTPKFYPGCKLVWVTCSDWESDRLLFIGRDDTVILLNGTSPAIHAINLNNLTFPSQEEPDRERVLLSYLEFFCFAVRGVDGPFHVLTERDLDPEISYGKFSASQKVDQSRMLEDSFRPPRVWGCDADGKTRVSCMIWYGKAVFFADFLVLPGGMIEMLDDLPIIDIGSPIGHPALTDILSAKQVDVQNVPDYNFGVMGGEIAQQKARPKLLQLIQQLEKETIIEQNLGDGVTVCVNGFGDILSVDIAHENLSSGENKALSLATTNLLKNATFDRRYKSVLDERAILEKVGFKYDDEVFKRAIQRYLGDA